MYLISGSDRPKIEKALQRLRRHFAPESVEITSALESSGADVVALCNAGSLFGDRRLVIVEDVDGRRDADKRLRGGWKAADAADVTSYVASPAPTTVLALVASELKKDSALWKAAEKAGEVLPYSVTKKEIHRWVAAQFKDRGVRAEPEACAALVHIVGEDLGALTVELDKIATWAAGEPIGEREVEALAAPLADEPPFALTDAWAARDIAGALETSETMFERGVKTRRDTAARLAAALGSHLGRLRSVKRLAADGVPPAEVVRALGAHPYVARKVLAQAEGFSDDDLADASVHLAALDGALKGQSRLAPDLEVQRTLAELARPRGAPGTGT